MTHETGLEATIQTFNNLFKLIFSCLPLSVKGSSLGLPPVSEVLHSISEKTCIHWPCWCHSNRGCEVIVAISRKSAICSDCMAMWSLSMRKDLVYFLHEQKQAGFCFESL